MLRFSLCCPPLHKMPALEAGSWVTAGGQDGEGAGGQSPSEVAGAAAPGTREESSQVPTHHSRSRTGARSFGTWGRGDTFEDTFNPGRERRPGGIWPE